MSVEQLRQQVGEFLSGVRPDGEWVVLTVDSGRVSAEQLAGVLSAAAESGTRLTVAALLAGFDRESVEAATGHVRHGRYLVIDQPGRGRWCGAVSTPCEPDLVARILDLLRTKISDHLRDELDRTGKGVENGLFRTPTLQVTNKWIDVDTLLREAVGTATSAFLIVYQMGKVPQNTQVLRVATATVELVEAVAASAGVRANPDVIIDEFDSSAEELDRLRDGTPVILCTDLVLTENSAKRAVAEAVNWYAHPIMVVTAFDARQHGGPIVLRDNVIPLVSLTEVSVSISVGPEAEPLNIDPVLRSVVRPQPRVERPYPWDPTEFLATCIRVDGALTAGHSARLSHRHLSIKVDLGVLIADDSPARNQIINRMATEVDQALPEPGLLVFCHPDHSGEYAGRLAALVMKEVQRRRPGIQARTLPVRRAVLGPKWAFPEWLDAVPPGCDVVLIDWGSVDAVTIHQLIRLAAEAGAGRILSVVLLSQLQRHDERALTMIESVEGVRTVVDGEPITVTVPTKVRFLTALGLSPIPVKMCPLCQLAKQFTDDARYGGLPALVQQHLERLAASLQVKTRADVTNSALDAFGARIDDVAAYVRLRLRLLAAIRDTGMRQAVADELANLAEDGDSTRRHAAIRLLAAERQWLALPPLRFAHCREAVADLAVKVALETGTRRRLRLQALIVLAKAAPEVLVRHCPRLWESFSGNSMLILHLIYHLHRISQYRRGDVPISLIELRVQIAACKESLQKNPFRMSGLNNELGWQLTKLIYEVDRRRVQDTKQDMRALWPALQVHYLQRLRQHNDAEAAMARLQLQVHHLRYSNELDDSSWAVVRRSWITVVTFIADYLLPFLAPLAPVLTGAFAKERFEAGEQECLKSLSSNDWLRYASTLETKFLRLRSARTRVELVAMQRELVSSLVILRRTVLAAGGTDLELAKLAEFVAACPATVARALETSQKDARDRGLPVLIDRPRSGADIELFCHEELLANTFLELIENAATRKHRSPGQEDVVVDLTISVTPDPEKEMIRVLFRNTGTVHAAQPGQGIASARRKLHDFGATLTPVPVSGPWTYAIELCLKRWQAGVTA